jgi:hypothetical protein
MLATGTFRGPAQFVNARSDDDGVVTHEVWKGGISTGSGYFLAHLKLLPEGAQLAEVLAAQLLEMLAIPSPRAFLVDVSKRDLHNSRFAIAPSRSRPGFATETRPTDTHWSGANDKQIVAAIANMGLPWLVRAAIFDELIANSDRSPGNMLINAGQIELIDHERANFAENAGIGGRSYFAELLKRECVATRSACWSELKRQLPAIERMRLDSLRQQPDFPEMVVERAIEAVSWRQIRLKPMLEFQLGQAPLPLSFDADLRSDHV